LGGSTPSAVDFHFYPWMYQHSFAGLSLDKYPQTHKWLANLAEMKEVKAAYEKIPKGTEM
jgi:glutathione S-transferase